MNPDESPPPKPNQQPGVPRQRRNLADEQAKAQLHIVEFALIQFIEQLLGRVPSDLEIANGACHYQFAASPLATYEKKGITFTRYFVWNGTEALALGFHDPKNALSLSVTRLTREDWPTALGLAVALTQSPENPGE